MGLPNCSRYTHVVRGHLDEPVGDTEQLCRGGAGAPVERAPRWRDGRRRRWRLAVPSTGCHGDREQAPGAVE